MFLASAILLLAGVALSESTVFTQTLQTWDENDDNSKIVNGKEPRAHSYPFLAKLYVTFNSEATYGCGGALINSKYILTAAHCVVDDEGRRVTEIQVLLGAHNLRQNEATRITRYGAKFVTANYNSQTKHSDVALILLSQAVTYTNAVSPICLARAGSSHINQYATVAGWGAIGSDMPSSPVLLQVELPIRDDSLCRRVYGGYDNSVMLCAGDVRERQDSCQGDSGGPLFVRSGNGFTSVGVVSYGYKCAEPGFPGVYAEVQHFVSWIQQNSAEGGAVCVA